MAVYACSMFFNEFRLLDLKMSEQMPYVDKMIIVESERTHSNQPKDLHLHGNKAYDHPNLKIVVMRDGFSDNSVKNEARQRDLATQNLTIKDDDIFISCDLDEIIPGKNMEEVIDQIKKHGHVRLGMKLYYYKINMLMGKWRNAVGVTGKYLKDSGKTLTQLRHEKKGTIIPTMGKHFSYLTDAQGIKRKLESFLHHQAWSRMKVDKIQQNVEEGINMFSKHGKKGRVVPVDDSYPDTILNNLDDWQEWIVNPSDLDQLPNP